MLSPILSFTGCNTSVRQGEIIDNLLDKIGPKLASKPQHNINTEDKQNSEYKVTLIAEEHAIWTPSSPNPFETRIDIGEQPILIDKSFSTKAEDTDI